MTNKIAYRGQTCLVFDELGKPTRRCFRNKKGKRINKSQRDKRFAYLKSLLQDLEVAVAENVSFFNGYSINVERIKNAVEDLENTIDRL